MKGVNPWSLRRCHCTYELVQRRSTRVSKLRIPFAWIVVFVDFVKLCLTAEHVLQRWRGAAELQRRSTSVNDDQSSGNSLTSPRRYKPPATNSVPPPPAPIPIVSTWMKRLTNALTRSRFGSILRALNTRFRYIACLLEVDKRESASDEYNVR